MKRLVGNWLGQPAIARLARRLLRGRATIFMLHRFADPRLGNPGITAAALEALLATLRREKIPICPLSELLEQWRDQPASLEGAVAFTVDDGYADFAAVGAPAFAKYDAPATVFLVTGFLDRSTWLWWDQVTWIAAASRVPIVADFDPHLVIDGTTLGTRLDSARLVVERLKSLPDLARRKAIETLAEGGGLVIPERAPSEYQPMTWEQVRSLSNRGFDFGPHTITHPILSRTDPTTSRGEIEGSWKRLGAELPGAVPIFCYPNGGPGDFGEREESTLGDLGLKASVSTVPEYLAVGASPFRIPRFALPSSLGGAVQIAFGVERAKAIVRGSR